MSLMSVSILLVSASEVHNPEYIYRHLLDSLYSYARSAFCTVSDIYCIRYILLWSVKVFTSPFK